MPIPVRVERSHVTQGARRHGAAASVGVDNKTASRGRCGRKGTQQLLSILGTRIVLLVILGKWVSRDAPAPSAVVCADPFSTSWPTSLQDCGHAEKALGVQAGATASRRPASPFPGDSRRRLATGLANGAARPRGAG